MGRRRGWTSTEPWERVGAGLENGGEGGGKAGR